METFSTEIYRIIANNDIIVIAAHVNPDGDAVSAVLSFAQSMNVMGKKPIVLLEDYSEKYNFIKGREFIFKGDFDTLNPDLFFAIDCGDKKRLGKAEEVFDRAKITFNIDHHISNNSFAQYNIVKADSSSSSEIIFDIIKNFCSINKDIASAIYSGIISDTCGFKYSCTKPKTHEVAATLIKYDIPFTQIHSNLLYSHSVEEAKVLATAIDNFKTCNNITYSKLSKEEIKKCNASYNDLDGIVEFLLNIKGTDVSLFVYEKEDKTVKMSFRSKSIDVNKIASKFGGGGHKLAAGANTDKSIDDILSLALKEIKNELKIDE